MGGHHNLEMRVGLHLVNLLEGAVHAVVDVEGELALVAPRPVEHSDHWRNVRNKQGVRVVRHPRCRSRDFYIVRARVFINERAEQAVVGVYR